MLHEHFMHLSRKVANLYSNSLLIILMVTALVFFWLFNFSSVPFSNPTLIKISGHDGLLDLLPYYSAQEAFTMLGHYGSAGRELYLKFLIADFIFIPIYSLGFGLLMTRVLRARFGLQERWLWLNLLPFAIGVFDCIEDLCILTMLQRFPQTDFAIGTLSGIATLCKTILTLIGFSILAYLSITILIRRIRMQSHGEEGRQ